MATAGVEEDEIELLHQSDCATPYQCRGKKQLDSRMFFADVLLGMHFLSDVVAGAAIGTALAYGAVWLVSSAT
jgi:hypothetical protein